MYTGALVAFQRDIECIESIVAANVLVLHDCNEVQASEILPTLQHAFSMKELYSMSNIYWSHSNIPVTVCLQNTWKAFLSPVTIE